MTIDFSKQDYIQRLEELPESCCCETVCIESDTARSTHILDHLIGIQPGTTVTRQDLQYALFYLKHSDQFATVRLTLAGDLEHARLSFYLYSDWTLSGLSCRGLWFGKDAIRNLYGLELGNKFKEEKHGVAVAQIRENLINRGYLQADVGARIKEKESEKSVDVALSVFKGPKYYIDNNSVHLVGVSDGDTELEAFIQNYIAKQLYRVRYKKSTIENIQQGVSNYLHHHDYPFAEVSYREVLCEATHKVDIDWTVTMNQSLKTEFVGNNFFSHVQLQQCIMDRAESLWSLSPPVCIEAIKELYRQHGLWDISVLLYKQAHCWRFEIVEGPQYLLGDIAFEGVENFSTQRLRRIFASYLKLPYREENIQKGLDALLSVYLEQGFWDIEIMSKSLAKMSDKQFCLTINIREGARRYLQSISIPGFVKLESRGPFARFKTVMLPVPFKFSYLKQQKTWLMRYFQKRGLRAVEIKPEYHETESGIELEWLVNLKEKQTRFGNTIVKGVSKTDACLIYRELCYHRGQLWSKKQLKETFFRIKDLGIYESVNIYPLAQADPSGEQPVVVKVVEDDPYELKARIGFQNVSKNLILRDKATYKVGGSFIYKNVTGNADQLRIDSDFTRFYRATEASYMVPWTFGYPVKTIVKGYWNKFDQPVYIGSKRTLYRARHNGGLIGWQYKCSDRTSAINVGTEYLKIDQLSAPLAQAIDFSFSSTLKDKWVPYLDIEPTIFIESLNDKLYPSKGFTTLLSAKWMLPLAKQAEYFFKVLIDQSMFLPISRAVLALRVRAGHIFAKNFAKVVPPERFYLGGANSIRCYLPDLAPPLGKIVMNDTNCCFPQGGNTMLNCNLEMRIPMWQSMTAVVFSDWGILDKPSSTQDESKSFQGCCTCFDEELWEAKLLGAIGVGFRYHTPIGPLRFDFGWNVRQHCDCDSPYAWYIALGHAF